ncbi:hypothetical protein CPB84DRAFT_1878072 [Gymnopilus junonius]|uniref:Uncharacterized protein n=1 Tax=Gymnopilus junonius TaxID=109634 RepID=A0A9P5TQL7_GYMJU|nr:hypothetical protein CPB84DRAFT_1878072 [Gymnopilus junonius]
MALLEKFNNFKDPRDLQGILSFSKDTQRCLRAAQVAKYAFGNQNVTVKDVQIAEAPARESTDAVESVHKDAWSTLTPGICDGKKKGANLNAITIIIVIEFVTYLRWWREVSGGDPVWPLLFECTVGSTWFGALIQEKGHRLPWWKFSISRLQEREVTMQRQWWEVGNKSNKLRCTCGWRPLVMKKQRKDSGTTSRCLPLHGSLLLLAIAHHHVLPVMHPLTYLAYLVGFAREWNLVSYQLTWAGFVHL